MSKEQALPDCTIFQFIYVLSTEKFIFEVTRWMGEEEGRVKHLLRESWKVVRLLEAGRERETPVFKLRVSLL